MLSLVRASPCLVLPALSPTLAIPIMSLTPPSYCQLPGCGNCDLFASVSPNPAKCLTHGRYPVDICCIRRVILLRCHKLEVKAPEFRPRLSSKLPFLSTGERGPSFEDEGGCRERGGGVSISRPGGQSPAFHRLLWLLHLLCFRDSWVTRFNFCPSSPSITYVSQSKED